jgi:hypothetical protein
MEIELSAEAKDKALNRRVAITVVIFSVAAGLCNIKDGNVVQAMQQATKTKMHLEEASRQTISALAPDPVKAAPVLADLDRNIAKYRSESPGLANEAKGQTATYDALNVHDDQFDAADASLATAISLAAVTALTENAKLLWLCWLFGAFGLFMGLCGFFKLPFHPDFLSTILG